MCHKCWCHLHDNVVRMRRPNKYVHLKGRQIYKDFKSDIESYRHLDYREYYDITICNQLSRIIQKTTLEILILWGDVLIDCQNVSRYYRNQGNIGAVRYFEFEYYKRLLTYCEDLLRAMESWDDSFITDHKIMRKQIDKVLLELNRAAYCNK